MFPDENINSDDEEHGWLLGGGDEHTNDEAGNASGEAGDVRVLARDEGDKPISITSHEWFLVVIFALTVFFVEVLLSMELGHVDGLKQAYEAKDGMVEAFMFIRRLLYIGGLVGGGFLKDKLGAKGAHPYLAILFLGFLMADVYVFAEMGRVSLEDAREGHYGSGRHVYGTYRRSEGMGRVYQALSNSVGIVTELIFKLIFAIPLGATTAYAYSVVSEIASLRTRGVALGALSAVSLAGSMVGMGLASIMTVESEVVTDDSRKSDIPRHMIALVFILVLALVAGIVFCKERCSNTIMRDRPLPEHSDRPIPKSMFILMARSLMDGIPTKAYSLYVSWYLFLGESEKTATGHGLSLAAAAALSAVFGGLIGDQVRSFAAYRANTAFAKYAELEAFDETDLANDAIVDVREKREAAMARRASRTQTIGRARPTIAFLSVVSALVMSLIHINASRTTKMMGGTTDVAHALRWMLPLSLLMFLAGNMEQTACDFPVVAEVMPAQRRGFALSSLLALSSLSSVLSMSTIGVVVGRKFTWAPGMLLEPGADGSKKGVNTVVALANTIMIIDLVTSVGSALLYLALTRTYTNDRTDCIREEKPMVQLMDPRTGRDATPAGQAAEETGVAEAEAAATDEDN